jgi:hypothetical protein
MNEEQDELDDLVKGNGIAMGGPEEFCESSIFNALSEYKSHLGACFDEYYKPGGSDEYYSPYFTVCQSSGYGKTRMNLECADEFIEFYICLRDKVLCFYTYCTSIPKIKYSLSFHHRILQESLLAPLLLPTF